MVTNLLVPDRRIVVPKPPSYLKLDMAFAIGSGAKLMDKSRYRSHGDITGASWATGLHGKALDFDSATPSYVEIPAAYTQLNFTSEDFSLVMRLKLDTLAGAVIPICRGASTADGWYFIIRFGGRIELDTSQSLTEQRSYSSNGDITTGTWYTVGFSREGASVKLFKNGVDLTSTAATHIDPLTSSRSAKIGTYDDKSSNPVDGKVEFFRIFGGIALPASTHLAYHNALA